MSAAFSEHPDADAVIFLGDGLRDAVRVFCGCEKTVAAVCGNCDSSGDFEAAKAIGAALPEITLDIGGVRVMCAHGHRYGVKSGLSRIAEAAIRARGAGLVLFGHTHVPIEVHLDGALLFNPGSIASGSLRHNLYTGRRDPLLSRHGIKKRSAQVIFHLRRPFCFYIWSLRSNAVAKAALSVELCHGVHRKVDGFRQRIYGIIGEYLHVAAFKTVVHIGVSLFVQRAGRFVAVCVHSCRMSLKDPGSQSR